MDLGEEYLGPKVLVVESQCKGAHDVIPTARKFAQELRRLQSDGYDVRAVTIKGPVVRNDRVIIPKCDLTLFRGELLEKPGAGHVGQRRGDH